MSSSGQGSDSHLVVCCKYTPSKQYFGATFSFKIVRNLARTPDPHDDEQSDHDPNAVTSHLGSIVPVSSLSILKINHFNNYYLFDYEIINHPHIINSKENFSVFTRLR